MSIIIVGFLSIGIAFGFYKVMLTRGYGKMFSRDDDIGNQAFYRAAFPEEFKLHQSRKAMWAGGDMKFSFGECENLLDFATIAISDGIVVLIATFAWPVAAYNTVKEYRRKMQ